LEHWLAATPVRNAAVREEPRDAALVLFVPLRQRWWTAGPVRWLLPLRRERGVALDTLGREVWSACDGERNIEALVAEFADRHRLGFHEARLTVGQFLRMLVERKLLVIVGRAGGEALALGPSDTPDPAARTDADAARSLPRQVNLPGAGAGV
jgi:hypothetical protein